MTRMWMGDPLTMCRNHLLGEHKELHQLIGQLRKKLGVTGYIHKNCIEVSSITSRHDALVREMERRGYRHLSPVPDQSEIDRITEYLPEMERAYVIDKDFSDRDRYGRCCNCCRGGFKV